MSNYSLAPEEEKALQEFAHIVADESAVVLSTLLDKKIDIKRLGSGPLAAGEISGNFPGEIVVVSSPFATGFDATNYFIINKPLVAKLSDLMMMGDGTAEFNEDHIDAIQEGINQMLGAAASALSSRLGKTVDFQPSSAKSTAFENAGLPVDDLTLATYELQIEGQAEGKIAMLVFYSVIKEATAALGAAAQAAKPSAGAKTNLDMDLSGFGLAGEGPAGAAREEAYEPEPAMGRVSFRPEATDMGSRERERLELLLDIKLDISIELGRTRMLVRDVLELGPGSVIELDKMSGESVDLLINNKKLAEGEVVVVDENFGVRITHLVSMEERIKVLQSS